MSDTHRQVSWLAGHGSKRTFPGFPSGRAGNGFPAHAPLARRSQLQGQPRNWEVAFLHRIPS